MFMKRICFCFAMAFVILFMNSAKAQSEYYSTLHDVIPPSPDASSVIRQNFSDVNLYTGKVNYSLPIYTISKNGYSHPLMLNYIGGGGIKVEEAASSVGLGWSLQGSGMISRTIKGIADDYYGGSYIGYMHLPAFDTTVLNLNHPLWSLYETNYSTGRYDGQPDMFSLNAPGLSGEFYINKAKEVVWNEKTDLKIKLIFNSYALTGFEVINLAGYTYFFDIPESARSVSLNSGFPTERLDYDISSWYLSKVTNNVGKTVALYTYQSGENNILKQLNRSPYLYSMFETFSSVKENTYTYTYYKKPILLKIAFGDGEVEFKMSANTRYDLAGDRYLDSIIVKNYLGEVIKKFHFNYSYFNSNGIIQEGQGQYYADGDPTKRLKLDSVQFISTDGLTQTYGFEYNISEFLPDKLVSYAMDHWGYYNGESANITWEAKNRIKAIKVNLGIGFDTSFHEFGSSNREPNIQYARAAILQQVKLPTGGTMLFDYEGHTSNDQKLKNALSYQTEAFPIDQTTKYFHVDLINQPFGYVQVKALVESGFNISFFIRDSLNSRPPIVDTLYDGLPKTFILEPGTYYIQAKLNGSHSDPSYHYGPILRIEKETFLLNKLVGGVRIKKITLNDSLTNINNIRNYYYNEIGALDNSSPSTGEVASIPQYGIKNIEIFSETYVPDYFSGYHIVPNGYLRQISSAFPLATTSGSHVGYKKVSVIDGDQLKTEYQFTSFSDFPEFKDGYRIIALTGDAEILVDGELHETQPIAPFDQRDYFRGKNTLEIQYKKDGNSFLKVFQKQNLYGHNYGIPVTRNNIELPDIYSSLPGMLFNKHVTDVGNGQTNEITLFKKYNLYAGKFDLKKTIETSYTYQNGNIDSLEKSVDYLYGQSPWFKDSLFHYLPTKIISGTSTGYDTIKNYYVFDWRNLVPEFNSSEFSILQELEEKNIIATPLLMKKSVDGILDLESYKMDYGYFNSNQIYPKIGKTKIGNSNNFENRIYFEKYDSIGNIIEQRKANDIVETYIYGYGNSFPVAKIVGATYANAVSFIDPIILNNANGQYTDAQIRTELNKIRIGLSSTQALVYTYTYKPLIGVTSETDPNNRTTYYEYDGFGRLKLIRDFNENILKQICYNYNGDAVTCSLNTLPEWIFSGNYRCVKNGSNQNTGYQEKEEIDINLYSHTYNQTRWVDNGYNITACPLPPSCSPSNCTGVNKKCVNNNCETGIRVNTDSYYDSGMNKWACVYHYEWSDGSWSQNYIQYSNFACPF